jgi:hypothetical protein
MVERTVILVGLVFLLTDNIVKNNNYFLGLFSQY